MNGIDIRRHQSRHGKKAAVVIQRSFRGHRVRHLHGLLLADKQVSRRVLATIRVQSLVRRWLTQRRVTGKRSLFTAAAVVIQRHTRGFCCRRELQRFHAGVRILKFMKKIYLFRFKDAVILIMHLKTYFTKRNKNAMIIQRNFRGFSARYSLFKDRLMSVIIKAATRKLCKLFLLFAAVLKRRNVVYVSAALYCCAAL